jgi:hypothetical protein
VVKSYTYDNRNLWMNTVYPASESENWFVSATSAYWGMLKGMPSSRDEALVYMCDQLAELNCRYNYTAEREGSFAPADAKRDYKKYNSYQIPRIKGTYLLHQLRLYMGNETFSELMNKVHNTYREKNITTADFIKTANQVSGKDMTGFINQWIKREDLPEGKGVKESINGKQLKITVNQKDQPYHYVTTVKINTPGGSVVKKIEVKEKEEIFTFEMDDTILSVDFNYMNDVLIKNDSYYTWSNILDDWKSAKIVYGTAGQIEANHTLALRFSTAIADRFTEDLIPVEKDSEVSEEDLKNYDLILLGSSEDNSLIYKLVRLPGLKIYKNSFSWNGITYSRGDEGLYLTLPNPYNSSRALYVFLSNSAPELYQMTKIVNRIPQWGVFRGDKIVDRGYYR